jgi:uncharacterized protein YdhG (YjbR/CyaY superfamily)
VNVGLIRCSRTFIIYNNYMSNPTPKTIDEYISNYPEDVQRILEGIRQTIQKVLPEAVETMSYGMPTFDLNGHHLVYFSAWKDHIGVYPLYTDGGPLKDLLLPLKKNNSIILPYTDPFPYDIVEKFTLFRKDEEAGHPSHH